MLEIKNEYITKLTDVQQNTLSRYSTIWQACISNMDTETSYTIYCKLLGYLDALMDFEQITKEDRDKIIRFYTR